MHATETPLLISLSLSLSLSLQLPSSLPWADLSRSFSLPLSPLFPSVSDARVHLGGGVVAHSLTLSLSLNHTDTLPPSLPPSLTLSLTLLGNVCLNP